jgi:uncharacterized damage-inducible protein DinB
VSSNWLTPLSRPAERRCERLGPDLFLSPPNFVLIHFFVPKLEPILEKLAHAQRLLLGTADRVPSDQWRTRPKDGGWSAAEIIAHLILVERGIVGNADRISHEPPRRFPLLKRFHLPLSLVESRIVRRKSPIPMDRDLIRGKETMLAELREVRERTLAFLDETKRRDLTPFCWRHAFLGTMNVYEWFQLVASHEIRHEKQMREIADSYRKP